MKKICILSVANIKHMSLITLYTDNLEKDKINYDIIYMDKYGEIEQYKGANKLFRFENKINRNDNKFVKIKKYLKFRKYAIQIIKKEQYDFIIVWNELTALIFYNYLVKKYNKKYCLNIRDYLYQDMPILRNIYTKVIKNASFTTISSDAFKIFLPKFEYINVHSINKKILSNVKIRNSINKTNKKIRISFIGNIRFLNNNKKLLDTFKNDNRFILCYYGTNANLLKKYCKENNILNVEFFDSFPLEDTYKFIDKTDIINNIYGNKNKKLDYALSIKLYYAIYSKIPILVSSDTYMEKLIKKYNIGFVVKKITHDLPNEIYNWYTNINFNEFNKNCEIALNDIEQDNLYFEKIYKIYIGI